MLIETKYAIGGSVYCLVRRADGKYRNAQTQLFATLSAGIWAACAISIDEIVGTGVYMKDVSLPAGVYRIWFYAKQGSDPAPSDFSFANEDREWDGTADRSLSATKLAADGLDGISTALPTAKASTYREMAIATWWRFYGGARKDPHSNTITTRTPDGNVITTQSYTSDAQGGESIGAAN